MSLPCKIKSENPFLVFSVGMMFTLLPPRFHRRRNFCTHFHTLKKSCKEVYLIIECGEEADTAGPVSQGQFCALYGVTGSVLSWPPGPMYPGLSLGSQPGLSVQSESACLSRQAQRLLSVSQCLRLRRGEYSNELLLSNKLFQSVLA